MRKKICFLLILSLLIVFLTGCQQGSQWHNTTIEFPNETFDKTEHNADIFEIEPFAVHFNIPTDWEIKAPEAEGSIESDLWSPVGIYKDDVLIGSIGYNTYEIYPDAGDNYRAIYNQLMLGSMINWDIDYTPFDRDGDTKSATCKVARSQLEPGKSNAESPVIYNHGVLAHNDNLLVYVGIEIQEDNVSESELEMLVSSIVLERIPE